MPKGSLISDTFEKMTEEASKTAKGVASALKNITLDITKDSSAVSHERKKENNKVNFSPLDEKKLEGQYRTQDTSKLDDLRRHFFDRVKKEEQEGINSVKQEAHERRKHEEEEVQKKHEVLRQQEQQGPLLPKGKQRKSIFATKKKQAQTHIETRVGSGKQ